MKTRVERVQVLLRAEILAGRIAPGSKLPLTELAAQTDATVGVVREALIRLVSEGLVVSEPQLGFRVMPTTAADLRDLVDARRLVECEAFGQAIEFGSLAWESRVMAAYHHLERTEHIVSADSRTDEAWVESHRKFHEALLEGCPNARLIAVAMQLRDAAELYRSFSVQEMTPADRETRDREHLALRNAAITRNAAEGRELLSKHIIATADRLHLDA